MTDRDSRDLKVLVVEDFEDTRLFMRLALEEHGFIVLEAENGQTAVENANREKPDVILMDLTMPLMDGFAAAKLIRQNEQLKNIPIIAVTAHQETDFRADVIQDGSQQRVSERQKLRAAENVKRLSLARAQHGFSRDDAFDLVVQRRY